MKQLVETYAHLFVEAFDTSEATHQATKFRKRTWGIGTNAGIGYDDVFDDDFFTKHEEVMTMANLNVLIQRYTAQMKELETRMAETSHKLEIILEASQLLVEEGLSDEYPADRPG
jgi:anion-transporting  ArsA/GET3 family ATPase